MSPASPLVAACILAALLALPACGPSHHAGQRGQAAEVGLSPAPATGDDTNADLRLLDAGAEPRAPLRYRLKTGQRESLVVELITELKLAIGDMSPPAVRSPTVYAALDLTVVEAGARVKLAGQVVKLDVPDDPAIAPNVIAAVRSDLDRLAGTPWTAVFTEHGRVDQIELPAPADANTQVLTTLDRLRDALHLLLPPLPDAPVGRGARWQVRRRAIVGPAHVDERTLYELKSTEEHPQLTASVGMDARAQPLTMPATPPGAKLELTSFEGGGKGTVALDLAGAIQPSTLRWSAQGRGTAHPAGEPPTPFTLNVETTISVRRR